MAEVVLEHVWKYYPGNVAAVRDFNLEIKDREFVVLVGPSGCGKSTTLRMIAGLEEVSRGSVRIGARVVNDIPPKDRDIAMVFQNYALYPHMTVYENMAFGLRLRRFKRAEIDRRVREAAEILGITEYLQRRPKALSGGQRQRVAVGRAIVRKPAAFLFDEPLSNLDAKLRVQMRTEISKLHKRLAATMIYVTHDQVEAMTMGDRIVVMKDGVAQQVDAPLKIYEAPANLFVAGFIGMPPMNFFTGAVAATGGRPVFCGDRAELALPAAWRGAAEKLAGAPAVLGIRPENIGSIAAEADPAALRLAARVELVELMGSETYLHLRSEAEPFIARVDAHEKFQVGQDCRLPVVIERAHLFDARTGVNLTT